MIIKKNSDNAELWSQFLRKSHDPAAPRAGLFHNKDLTSPAGFKKYAERTLDKAKALVEKIVGASTRDELVECAALVRSIRRGELDRLWVPDAPLDILAQQIVAMCAAQKTSSSETEFEDAWNEDDLFRVLRRAYPYRNLSEAEYHSIIEMLSEGIASKRGRYGAYLHRDQVNRHPSEIGEGCGGKAAWLAVGEPDGVDAGSARGGDVVFAVADHPGVLGCAAVAQPMEGEEEGLGVWLVGFIFAGHQDIKLQAMGREYVAGTSADLIAIGSEEVPRLQNALLGSVSLDVVTQAACDVLLARVPAA